MISCHRYAVSPNHVLMMYDVSKVPQRQWYRWRRVYETTNRSIETRLLSIDYLAATSRLVYTDEWRRLPTIHNKDSAQTSRRLQSLVSKYAVTKTTRWMTWQARSTTIAWVSLVSHGKVGISALLTGNKISTNAQLSARKRQLVFDFTRRASRQHSNTMRPPTYALTRMSSLNVNSGISVLKFPNPFQEQDLHLVIAIGRFDSIQDSKWALFFFSF
jgi:hypothetical protein